MSLYSDYLDSKHQEYEHDKGRLHVLYRAQEQEAFLKETNPEAYEESQLLRRRNQCHY